MISFKPRSILQLTVLGFMAVTALLIIGLAITAKQLDGVSDESQRIITQFATASRASRTLIEQITAMERNARQYTILGDKEILAVYGDRRKTFVQAAEQIRSYGLDPRLAELVNSLLINENRAYNSVKNNPVNLNTDGLYPPLVKIAHQIADGLNDWSESQITLLRDETAETQKLLTIQAGFLISAALGLAALFTALITRPLIQMEKAINHLGSGAYEKAITIGGPRDLSNLGARLEWLRSRLGKLEQQRSSFLRHVSHELKTPLAAIRESAALLSDGVVGELNEEQRNILRIAQGNCQRLQGLIDDLLRYNSESFSVLNTMPVPVRFDQVVEKVIANHELTIKNNSLVLDRLLPRLEVLGDPEQIRVVVDNLLSNAIKYSPDGGRVAMHLYEASGKVIFEIEDEGPGIKKDEWDKVFEAFYQGQPPSKDIYRGSGLGLAITQEYVQANGGTIAVMDSQQGARFRVEFPQPKGERV